MIYDVIEVLLRRLSLRAREVYDEIEKLDERASREGTSPEEVDNDEAGRRSMSEDRKLRELRQEKGWSVEELAEHSGVDEDIIRAIERDRWYREYDGIPYTPEEAEVFGRLVAVFGVERQGMIIDNPPSFRPGDIVLGAEALDLLPREVIEANSDRVGIAVPDPETGELGLIRYNRLTPEDLERIVEYSERRRAAIESHKDRLLDHLSRMQEMGLERDESWREHEERRQEEGSG